MNRVKALIVLRMSKDAYFYNLLFTSIFRTVRSTGVFLDCMTYKINLIFTIYGQYSRQIGKAPKEIEKNFLLFSFNVVKAVLGLNIIINFIKL